MKLLLLIILSFTLTGCITTYRDFPVDALDKKPAVGTCEVMQYTVKRFDVLDAGGYTKLQEELKNAQFCKKMVLVDAVPEKGMYLEVETKWKPLSLPAFIFGYLSASTLTILPAWSTHDGYNVKYNLYQDGQVKETYRYDITRKAGLWLVLLPFVWVNAFTYSEEDAFKATAHQFSFDAQAYLKPQASLNGAR